MFLILGAEGKKKEFLKKVEKFSSSRKKCSPSLVIRERQITFFPSGIGKKDGQGKCPSGEGAKDWPTSAALLVGVEIEDQSSLVT